MSTVIDYPTTRGAAGAKIDRPDVDYENWYSGMASELGMGAACAVGAILFVTDALALCLSLGQIVHWTVSAQVASIPAESLLIWCCHGLIASTLVLQKIPVSEVSDADAPASCTHA